MQQDAAISQISVSELHEADEPNARGVTRRVVVFSLSLALFFGYVMPIIDVKLKNTYLGAQPLPVGVVGALLALLLVVNPLMNLLSRQGGFSRNEVLTIYITCLFSCLVPGHGAENYFVGSTIGPFYFATPENGWLEAIAPNLKAWFTPALWASGGTYNDAGRRVVEGWYNGTGPTPWAAWLVPILAWTTLIFATYFLWVCLAVIFRGQWAQREALAFPLLKLPQEMTHDLGDASGTKTPSFFRNPLMWIGFAIAATAQFLNGANFYISEIPSFPLSLETGALFTESPWNQLGWFPIIIYPIGVGVAYLLTSEVSFSLWFFYLFFKFQYILAYYFGFMPNTLPNTIGWAGIPAKTFTAYQQLGAYIVYTAVIFYTGREHFSHIARRALRREKQSDEERHEALSYPVAFWGALGCFAFLILWSVAAGIRADVAFAIWSFYVMCVIVLARVVVESGMLYVQQGFTPLGTFAQTFGSGPNRWLAPDNLAPAGMIQSSMIIDLRANILPSFLHGFKLARERGIALRPLLFLIAAVVVITYALGVWQGIRLGYENGGLQLHGTYSQGLPRLAGSVSKELSREVSGMSWTNWLWLALGGAETWALMLLRSRFLWFPLHPIGMLLALTHPMFMFWFSIFLGWLCKVLIMRFGGSSVYRQMTPAFLGLILGDVAMMIFWLVIDGWQGRQGHCLLPG
jgi:hypothetical protein